MLTATKKDRIYDATTVSRLLGFPCMGSSPIPKVANGEIVIAYGGWSLQELRDSDVGKQLMQPQSWYDKYPWSRERLPRGTYPLRIPVPGSSGKTFDDQEAMLRAGEEIAPVVLVATALLVHKLDATSDLLKNDWTRCRERTAVDCLAVLTWSGNRLCVNDDWALRSSSLWVSSVRTP